MTYRKPDQTSDELAAVLAPLLGTTAANLEGFVVVGFRADDQLVYLSNANCREALVALMANAIAHMATELAEARLSGDFN